MPFSGFGILKFFAQGNFSAVAVISYLSFSLVSINPLLRYVILGLVASFIFPLGLSADCLVDAVAFSGPFYLNFFLSLSRLISSSLTKGSRSSALFPCISWIGF